MAFPKRPDRKAGALPPPGDLVVVRLKYPAPASARRGQDLQSDDPDDAGLAVGATKRRKEHYNRPNGHRNRRRPSHHRNR